ncbi:thymidylate synthase/dCMP hydroxymethylase domain-containing protein [Hyaloraphidium curvatum]|nr:thymidylate synthase/dCMP hydroxymethylase domain-containing protein [Hyaloraphidium curvatum]
MLASMEVAAGEHPEQQYLSLARRILEAGEARADRTGTGTLSLFAPPPARWPLGAAFPLLTTKRVFFRGVAEELLWFVRGRTDGAELSKKGVKIWDGNGSRAFLDSRGLHHRREGDLGPVYGYQWRHFGAPYADADADYAGKGVDQLREVVDKICHAPADRRIIISAWNPADIPQMALPPCHMMVQFFVSLSTTPPTLSAQMYQRSADMGLGVPFNIASYALLVRMIAHVTGTQPGELVHVLGDAHVYADHVDALKEQLGREPRPFPVLRIERRDRRGVPEAREGETREEKVDRMVRELETFEVEDFVLEGYDPHKAVKMEMSV